ncbi:unnamed protein product [Phaedon cochleariae]|uniref:Origin recognition complex subunit 1 n=1 Tax=Phaedon cochleariae TaxID=80249 RepID=A0A9P0DGL0_PHACE|nr:unnamed protein product [Phaedon cochleariae]
MVESVEISLESPCSDCKYHRYESNGNLCFSEVSIKGETYTSDDYIVIEGKKGIEIVNFICLNISGDKTFFTVLRKFILAKNERKLFKRQGITCFDQDNEVVEDRSSDHCIELNLIANAIIKRCQIICLAEDEDPSSYFKIHEWDRANTFICRFTKKSEYLYPMIPADQTILTENSYNSPVSTRGPKKSTDKPGMEITPSTYVMDTKENNKEAARYSPPRRNSVKSVKRDLNKSFGNSPNDQSKSILNYSVRNDSDDESDNPTMNYSIVDTGDNKNSKSLVIKLKAKSVSVDSSSSILNDTSPKARKSSRNIERKSYADYMSPFKGTPTKRSRKPSVTEEYVPKSNKVARETPTKTPSRKVVTQITRSRRNIMTPQRYTDDIYTRRVTLGTPRSLRSQKNRVSYNEEKLFLNELENFSLEESPTRLLKVNLCRFDPDTERIIRENPNCEVEVIESEDEKFRIPKDSTIPKTPKSRRKSPRPVDTDSDYATPPSTPKTRRGASCRKSVAKDTPKRTPKTPRNRARLIREGVVTPSMHARSKKVNGVGTPLMMARSQLHVSYVPDSLPCREKEYCDVFNFVEGKLLDRCGGCMYISGVPGTGKTATVTSAINNLLKNDDVPKFTFINVNGMRLTEPRQAYVEILKQLQGKSVPWEQAQSMLDDIFNKSKKLKPVVMLIDELDVLCTKRQDVVYNLLDWPTKAQTQLVVITIANTMDLPERLLMSRVTSRLGLTRLTFNPYTHKQLQEIVTRRLCGTESFNPDAVQFVARKVASVSGDARRALDICRRAAEITEAEGKSQLVSMNHVNEALNAMITQPKIRAIKHCSKLEQLIMQSIVAEVERTGVEETTFADVFKMFQTCAAIEGFKMVSTTVALSAVARLGACRLILTEQKGCDIYQRIILNVSVDDVYYALKNY